METKLIYVEYNLLNGYVRKTYENEPLQLLEGYAVAKSNQIELNQEFEFYITVAKVEEGFISQYGMIRQAPSISHMLEENNKLKEENLSLKLVLAEQTESAINDKLELQLAIAEMAEGGNV